MNKNQEIAKFNQTITELRQEIIKLNQTITGQK